MSKTLSKLSNHKNGFPLQTKNIQCQAKCFICVVHINPNLDMFVNKN